MEIDVFGLTMILIGLWQLRQSKRRTALQPVEITWRSSQSRTKR